MSTETDKARMKGKLDAELDRELADTFPASDALSVTRRIPDKPLKRAAPAHKADKTKV